MDIVGYVLVSVFYFINIVLFPFYLYFDLSFLKG